MTKHKINIHKLGNFLLPACVMVVSIGFGLIISVYGQVSADTINKLNSCVNNISTVCKNLGYDEKCTNSPIFSQFAQIKSLNDGVTDTTCTGDSCYTNDAISQKLSQCEALLEEAKKMDKIATPSSGKTDTATDSSDSTDNSQSVSSDDYGYMSNQSFSATSITSAASDSKCKGTKKGQIILVSNIKAGSGSIQGAFYNSLDWTKRGKVFDISTEIKSSIIEKLKKENKLKSIFGTIDEKVIEANLISGSVFYDVPLGQNFSGLIYSSSWSGKSLAISSFEGPKSECESTFVAVNYVAAGENLTDKYKVCVHSKDKSKDYKEKKTFIYPEDKTEAEAFKLADKDRIISLGPCQTDETSGGNSGVSSGSANGSGQSVGESSIGIGAADVSSGSNSEGSTTQTSDEWDQQALIAINKIRSENGVGALKVASDVREFAYKSIRFVADGNHESGDSLSQNYAHRYFADHMSELGGMGGSEIRIGAPGNDPGTSPEECMRGYERSPEHWAEMISPRYNEVGVSHITDSNGYIWHLVVFRVGNSG
jgi:uncharacterized protein YkwD